MTQRPYIASSSYLKKQARLSDEDCKKWDNLYAGFINRHKDIIRKTYMSVGHIKKAEEISGQCVAYKKNEFLKS